MEWYYILLIVVGAILLLLLLFAAVSYQTVFGKRCDKNPLLKYFSAEDFSLETTPIEAKRGMRGFIYAPKAQDNGKVVVFCHGMGAGQAMYMTEINCFCSHGFTVVALDNLGCGMSAGKSMRGMYSGVQTAVAAYDIAKRNFPQSKIFFVGHSWGGYSALCATAERKADGAVALSAPVSYAKTMYYGAGEIISKPLAALLCPFWIVVAFFKYGFNCNKNAVKCAKKSGVPALLVQGDKDTVVPLNKSAYGRAKGENLQKYLAEGKSHNPYNSPKAQQLMIELSAKLSSVRKMGAEERNAYFNNFDFVAATEEDEEVMDAILQFLAQN